MVIILQVTVTDVNDNKAQFSATSYHFSVNENLDEGVVVAQITASDLDYGINGKFIKILLMKLEIHFDVKNKTFEFKKEHNKTLSLCYIQLFEQSESLNHPPSTRFSTVPDSTQRIRPALQPGLLHRDPVSN